MQSKIKKLNKYNVIPKDTDSKLNKYLSEFPTVQRNINNKNPATKSKKLISSKIFFLLPNKRLKIEFKNTIKTRE